MLHECTMIAAAIPDETAGIHLCHYPLTCASIPLSKYVLPLPPGWFMLRTFDHV